MNEQRAERELQAMRAALSTTDVAIDEGKSCPTPEEIWEASRGAFDSKTRREYVRHAATCAACTEAWRLAREFGHDDPVVQRSRGRHAIRIGLASAAAIVLLAFTVLFQQESAPEPVTRERNTLTISSALPDAAILSREEFVLRWTEVGDDAWYRVDVTSEDLRPLASTSNVTETFFRVPKVALESIESGDVVLWRVEAVLPNDSRVSSPTFRAEVK